MNTERFNRLRAGIEGIMRGSPHEYATRAILMLYRARYKVSRVTYEEIQEVLDHFPLIVKRGRRYQWIQGTEEGWRLKQKLRNQRRG